MNINDVIELTRAGFTKAEIMAMIPEDPKTPDPAPAPAPDPAPAPAPAPENPDFKAELAAMRQELKDGLAALQAAAVKNDSYNNQPKTENAGEMLARFIKKEAN